MVILHHARSGAIMRGIHVDVLSARNLFSRKKEPSRWSPFVWEDETVLHFCRETLQILKFFFYYIMRIHICALRFCSPKEEKKKRKISVLWYWNTRAKTLLHVRVKIFACFSTKSFKEKKKNHLARNFLTYCELVLFWILKPRRKLFNNIIIVCIFSKQQIFFERGPHWQTVILLSTYLLTSKWFWNYRTTKHILQKNNELLNFSLKLEVKKWDQ